MDGSRFDQLVRGFGQLKPRRTVLAMALGAIGAVVAGETVARPRRGRGPCGDGSAKANACKRNRQCCTKYCHKKSGRCRCRKRGQSCKNDRSCCRRSGRDLRCVRGTCQSPICGYGAPCRVFVTSQVVTGDMGGLAGADQLCQEAAVSASLSGTYRAWLSDVDDSPRTRFANRKNTGPYVLVNNIVIAADWAELTSGELRAPINVSASGTIQDGQELVWTGTKSDGTRCTSSPVNTCQSWTTTVNADGCIGRLSSQNELWTATGYSGCAQSLRLYCFEQM